MKWPPGTATAAVTLITNTAVLSIGLIAAGDGTGSSGHAQVPAPHCTVTAPCEPPTQGWMVQPLPGQPGGGTWADRAPFAGDDQHPPHPGIIPSNDPPGFKVLYPPGWSSKDVNNNTTR